MGPDTTDKYIPVFRVIGESMNLPIRAHEMLERVAEILVSECDLRGCQFRLLSRDFKLLEHAASSGLSERFLAKGPVEAERSVVDALRGEVVAVLDCTSDRRIQYPEAFAAEGIASLLTVPLKTRGQVIGVMRLFTAEPREFTADEVAFFEVVAQFCTSAATHAMFHLILEHVTRSIRSSLDLGDVLNSIVRVVAEDLRIKGCSIRLLEGVGRRLGLSAAFGLGPRYLDTASADPGSGVYQALEGEPVVIPDVSGDPRLQHPDEAIAEGIASMLFVPLVAHGRPLGVLSLYTHNRYEFSGDEIQLMSAIAEQCSLAITNAQMYAAVKSRYQTVVDEFHQWFEHYQSYPHGTGRFDTSTESS